MRKAALVMILSLAIGPAVGSAEQGQGQGKAKGKAAQSKGQGDDKGKGSGKKAVTPGTPGSPGTPQGGCSPDTTPPVIQSVSATPNVLWPPNHRMTPVQIRANVADNCGAVTWAVTAIGSDESVNGTGDGDTAPDWAIGSPHAVTLRAERAGTGDGRVYTITIVARDAANNTSTATTTVTVPHNR